MRIPQSVVMSLGLERGKEGWSEGHLATLQPRKGALVAIVQEHLVEAQGRQPDHNRNNINR